MDHQRDEYHREEQGPRRNPHPSVHGPIHQTTGTAGTATWRSVTSQRGVCLARNSSTSVFAAGWCSGYSQCSMSVAWGASVAISRDEDSGWYTSLPSDTSRGDWQRELNSRDTLKRKSPPYMNPLNASQAASLTSGRAGLSSSAQLSNISKNA